MRKTLLLLILLATITYEAFSQQRPQYTQYVFNNYLLNPALSGIENYTDAKFGYRSQWTGLNGAPVTSYFTINAPIGTNFTQGDATAMPAGGGENPSSRSYTQYYQAAPPHHGIGLMLVNDQTGQGTISQTNIDATYAYHIGLSSTFNLSLGVAAGVERSSLNTSLTRTEVPDDPAIDAANTGIWNPDAGVGVWLYTSNFYFGASVQQLLKQKLYFDSKNELYQNYSVPHLFFTAGYKFYLADDVALMPSVLLQQVNNAPITTDVTAKLSFKDVFWLGAAYRSGDSYSALVGFNINSFINVGYSYDVTTSALNEVSNGSHEIVIGILLNNRYKVTCPQHQF